MRGGYKGYYKQYALDSSYEYIYCKVLEHSNEDFDVHVRPYQLDGRQYVPDFFIYNSDNEIKKIVEIRGHRLNLEERVNDVAELSDTYNLNVELITEIDLKSLCKECNLSYNKLKTEWRNSLDTQLNFQGGEFNAMYGLHHSDDTKRILSEKGKRRMADEAYVKNITSKLIQWNIDNNWEQAKKPRAKRVVRVCEYCGKEDLVTEAIFNNSKYCSQKCALKVNDGSKAAKEENLKRRKELHSQIKIFAEDFANEHAEEIIKIKLNKISTSETILEMLDGIKNSFGIIDNRTIGIAICGKPSRKAYVSYLKQLTQK